MKRALLTLAVGLATTTAGAGEVEIAVQLGRSLPFYQQTFALNPDQLVPPDVPVSTSGSFDLELGGGLTLGGAITWRFTDFLGLEARLDSAQVELDVTGGTVTADIGDLLPGLPSIPVSGEITGETEVDRLSPVSLNLQFVAGEKVRFAISGGASYIPSTTVAARVGVRLGANVPGLPELTLPTVTVGAAATLEGGFGGNLGVGLRVPVASGVALVFDARAWGFPKRELQWGPGGSESSILDDALAEALDPIEFQYGFFQASGGLAFTF